MSETTTSKTIGTTEGIKETISVSPMGALPKQIDSKEESTQMINLKYPTEHLKGFNELRTATKLKGDLYNPILKSIWYALLSWKNSETILKLNHLETDGRINLLVPLLTGKGKTELKKVIMAVMEGINKTIEEPTSLHPEQLVGRTSRRQKNQDVYYENNPGYLSRDVIIIDEGKKLLTENDPIHTESRRYLRLALDSYPNKIFKRSVDTPFDNALSYSSYVGCVIFTQPHKFPEDFANDGDLRRFITPYVPMSGVDRSEAYKSRIFDETDTDQALNKFIGFIESLNDYKKYKITKDGQIEFLRVFEILLERGFSYSKKIRGFMDSYDFTLQNQLLKLSAIQALQDGTNEIDKKHVALASIDLLEFLEHMYIFITTKIEGCMDYGEEWNGATDKDRVLLSWLHNNQAISLKTSKISIQQYETKIQEVFDVEKRQSINIKRKHERNGWIKSKKGRHESWVWLGFKPEVRPARGETSRTFEEFYHNMMGEYISEPITPLAALNKDNYNKKNKHSQEKVHLTSLPLISQDILEFIDQKQLFSDYSDLSRSFVSKYSDYDESEVKMSLVILQKQDLIDIEHENDSIFVSVNHDILEED